MASLLAKAHVHAQVRLRDVTAATVNQVWQNMPGYDERDVPTFLHTALPIVNAGQRHSISLVDGFLAQVMGRAPLGLDPDELIPSVRGDVAPGEVYHRQFVSLWSGLKAGKDWEVARAEATSRMVTRVRTDLLLAQNLAGRAVATADPDIYGLGRVTSGTCDLCTEAASQATPATGLQSIHPGCECAFDAITKPLPKTGHAVAQAAAALAEDRVGRIEEHGEYGPLLVYKDLNFMSAEEVSQRDPGTQIQPIER